MTLWMTLDTSFPTIWATDSYYLLYAVSLINKANHHTESILPTRGPHERNSHLGLGFGNISMQLLLRPPVSSPDRYPPLSPHYSPTLCVPHSSAQGTVTECLPAVDKQQEHDSIQLMRRGQVNLGPRASHPGGNEEEEGQGGPDTWSGLNS